MAWVAELDRDYVEDLILPRKDLIYFLRRNPLNLLGTTSEGSRRGSEGKSEGRKRGPPTTEMATCAENGR